MLTLAAPARAQSARLRRCRNSARDQCLSLSGSGRLAGRPLHAVTYGVAVVKKMSVGFAVFPLFACAKNGRKMLPLWVRPSYSPRKCPRAAGATGAVSMSNDTGVIRCSPLHVAPWLVEETIQ